MTIGFEFQTNIEEIAFSCHHEIYQNCIRVIQMTDQVGTTLFGFEIDPRCALRQFILNPPGNDENVLS